MDAERERVQDIDEMMALFGDVLVLYLAVGTVMGDCDLYRRMGHALAAEDVEGLRAVRAEFAALHPVLRRRILAGDLAFDPEAADEEQAEATDPISHSQSNSA